MRRKQYLLNHWFIAGLLILFINDAYLKSAFGNFVTGKLSDFAGVFILPFLLSFFFPKSIKSNIIATAIFFIWWKSPFSQDFINSFNNIEIIKVGRIIDLLCGLHPVY